LFKYATTGERWLLVFATFLSLSQGGFQSCMYLILGNSIGDLSGGSGSTPQQILDALTHTAITAFIFGCGNLVAASIAVYIWRRMGRILEKRTKDKFFESIIKHDTAWYDIISSEKITSIYNEDTSDYVKAVGDQNHLMFTVIGMSVGGFAVGFSKAALYSCIMLASGPFCAIGFGIMIFAIKTAQQKRKTSYLQACGHAEQGIYGIRTTKSLNGNQHELDLYKDNLVIGEKIMLKYGPMIGISFGSFF